MKRVGLVVLIALGLAGSGLILAALPDIEFYKYKTPNEFFVKYIGYKVPMVGNVQSISNNKGALYRYFYNLFVDEHPNQFKEKFSDDDSQVLDALSELKKFYEGNKNYITPALKALKTSENQSAYLSALAFYVDPDNQVTIKNKKFPPSVETREFLIKNINLADADANQLGKPTDLFGILLNTKTFNKENIMIAVNHAATEEKKNSWLKLFEQVNAEPKEEVKKEEIKQEQKGELNIKAEDEWVKTYKDVVDNFVQALREEANKSDNDLLYNENLAKAAVNRFLFESAGNVKENASEQDYKNATAALKSMKAADNMIRLLELADFTTQAEEKKKQEEELKQQELEVKKLEKELEEEEKRKTEGPQKPAPMSKKMVLKNVDNLGHGLAQIKS